MCVDCTEMKLIRKDNALQMSQAHMHGMRIRAANRNNPLPTNEKLVPALKCFKDWTMPNKLRKIGIKSPMQFGQDKGLELAQSIPEFDTCIALHLPGLPGDVCFFKGRGVGVAGMSDKR